MKQKIKQILMDNHRFISICIATLCCVLAYLGAFMLRFDSGVLSPDQAKMAWLGLPIMIAIRLIFLTIFQVNRGLYRYVSVHDVVQLIKAVTLGSLCFATFWWLTLNHLYFMPRSIYIIDWMLCLALLVGLRLAVRLYRSQIQKSDPLKVAASTRTLIVGAGSMGEAILRIIDRRFLGKDNDVVGFVDDDPMKRDGWIHGVPVLGEPHTIRALVERYDVKTVTFAISDPPQGLFEKVVADCDGLSLSFNTVSVLKDVASGDVSVDRMRRLKVEDLLGRKTVEVDASPVREAVSGKTVLVTGAGGSIGSELCRQIALFGPQQLVLLDVAESPIFEIDRELRQHFPQLDIQPFIGDIKHEDVVERAFAKFKPDYVYHAAAYKHVPLMEAHPDEAVLNNVRGTRYLAEAARRHLCERFVMISSDKAVRPTNVMGATKRMCELIIQSMNGADTIFTAVRFGNVLGSNGSVIPIFRKQIEAGGPLTITHADMTRYFMTIPEAVTLVLQCGVIAEGGDIFVLDMGTPVKIMDLARNMIRLSGLRENIDITIEISGLRPGEKMYEELVAYGEELIQTSVPKVNVLKQTSLPLARDVFMAMIHRLEELALQRSVDKTREMLWRMIDLDIQRAQVGMETLSGKSVDMLVSEWADAGGLPPSRLGEMNRGRILGVVSNLGIQDTLTAILNAVGYELDCLDSSKQALSMLASERSYIAILCDFIMPDETVWKFWDKVRATGSDLPVLAMSQYDSSAVSEILEIDHGILVLDKPFDGSTFEKALAQAIGSAPVV